MTTAPLPDFASMIDLAQARLGGQTLLASDDFFAEKENLLKPGRGVFLPDEYTDRGKWMDGWETRRKRVPGHDWCILKLGVSGVVHGVDIDTNHFRGNYPEHASVDALVAEGDPSGDELAARTDWVRIVPMRPLTSSSRHLFPVSHRERWTHLRLNIYPDGGVARFRVHGQVVPNWARLCAAPDLIDLGAVEHGGVAVLANDMFFSHPNNLLMPGRAPHMGDGWETKRRRAPGHDWCVIRLGTPGTLARIEVDTNHFKGNYPESCSIEGVLLDDADVAAEHLSNLNLDWRPILPRTKLEAHTQHLFESELLAGGPYSHVRLCTYPDGGVSRLRLWGRPVGRFGAEA